MTYSLNSLHSWILETLVICACLAAWGYGLYASRFQPVKIRVLTTSIRLIIIFSAWLIVHEFTLISYSTRKEPLTTAFLLDNSGSMSISSANSDHNSRKEEGLKVIEESRKSDMKSSVFSFDTQLVPGVPKDPSSSGTDFMAALTQLISQEPDLAQIVLISDGHDFSPLSRMSSSNLESWLKASGMPPIHSVFIGTLDDQPDLLIHSVEAPSFSYIRTPVKIDVSILARKLNESSPQVQLLEDEKVIQFQTAALDEHGFGRVAFEIYPDRVGEHLYQIRIPARPEEKNTRNNTQNVLVQTGRDKINVLHIAGSVTPDLQGLRSTFENDPFIDFTAFYILRTQEHMQIGVDGRMIPPDEMALVQFPVEEIFDRQLFSFDVVVFQDFDAGNYFQNSYQARKLMRKISTFVREQSGGLIVIGGPRTASGPSLSLTSVGEILPILPKTYRTRYQEKERQMIPTQSGLLHPILEGMETQALLPDQSSQGKLPRIFGFMETDKVHPEANLLISTPEGDPILATRHVGNGRTVFLNSSSSWIWRRDALEKGETTTVYNAFWRDMLKWASGDPTLNPSQVTPSSSQENPLHLQTEIALKDQDYQPLQQKSGKMLISAVEEGHEPVVVPFTTSKNGQATISADLEQPGFYRLKIQAGEGVPELEKNIFLGGSVLEHQENDPLPETLKLLSELSGGTFYESPLEFSAASLTQKQTVRETILETRRTRLRDSIYLLPFLLFLAALEWFIRRQNHLA